MGEYREVGAPARGWSLRAEVLYGMGEAGYKCGGTFDTANSGGGGVCEGRENRKASGGRR